MLATQRHELIMERLKMAPVVKVAELIEECKVSMETVRRDLELLESQGKLKRVHGGAVRVEQQTIVSEQNFTARELLHLVEKREIAELATQFVEEGQSVALDVSTTNTEVARALKRKFSKLTILTNSLPIAIELHQMPHYTIILTGGTLRNEELCVVGGLAEQFISQFHVDVMFMSMSGISLTHGLTDYGTGEWLVKKKMLEGTKKSYVVADYSKFDSVALLKVCDLHEVNGILTDQRIPEDVKELYINSGAPIITK